MKAPTKHCRKKHCRGFPTAILHRGARWARNNVPVGLRTLGGVVLIVGGVFGFLPILGFWMIPAGAALIALDITPLRRRLTAWLNRRKHAGE